MSLVSISTCTHERPEMLKRCVASVRAQTRGEWEHLVTDDGSTSTEQELALVALASDPRVRVRRRPHVDQPARYWNEMIDLARGDYLCFLDDDNEMLPEYVEVMAGELDRVSGADAVTCGMVLDDGRLFQKNLVSDEEIWERNTVDNGCFMIRREALERVGYYPLCVHTLEDWALMRRVVGTLRVRHLDACLTRYHEHRGTRSKRAEALGLVRDEAWVRAERWSPTVGVRVASVKDESVFAKMFNVAVAAMLRTIPWVAEGDDLTLSINYDGALDRVVYRDEAWVLVRDEVDFAAARPMVGAHVLACAFDGHDLRGKLVRVINSVRSYRYEAVI